MKGKLAIVIAIMLANSVLSWVSGKAVFNPMLPSELKYYGAYDSIPLEIFGEEPYKLTFGSNNGLYYPFMIDTFKILYDSKTKVTEKDGDLLIERVKNRVFFFNTINLIVTFDVVGKDENESLEMSFIDSTTEAKIGTYVFDSMYNQIEVLSKKYFVCSSKLYEIGKGLIKTEHYSYHGVNPELYEIGDDVFRRIDDSFVFSLKPIYDRDWHPISSTSTKYFYCATDIQPNREQNIISIKKVNFQGGQVKQWDKIVLGKGEDNPFINDDRMLIGNSERANFYSLRYMDLETKKDLWSLSEIPSATSFFGRAFYKGSYYQKCDGIAMKVEEDGTTTFVPIPFDPIYLTFRGQRFVLKGVPGSDFSNLFLRLVRLDKDCQIETDMQVPYFQHYAASGNILIGWGQRYETKSGKSYQVFDYQITKLTTSGLKTFERSSADMPWSGEITDFENLQAAEYISKDTIRIFDLETNEYNDVSVQDIFKTGQDVRIIYTRLKANHLALYYITGSGKTTESYIVCYSISPFKLLFDDKLEMVSKSSNRTLNIDFSGQNQNPPYFVGNCLLVWDMQTPFKVYNLIDGSFKEFEDWNNVMAVNGILYSQYGDKIDILNPVTFEMKSVNFKGDQSFAQYLPWISEGLFDDVDAEVFPQNRPDRMLTKQFDGWYSTVSRLGHSGELVKIESCPAFSIKRSSNNEFVITNTSPNCQKPLNASVYLIPWSDEGCPAYWQARNVVGKVKDLKLNETSMIKISDLELLQSKKFALVIKSNGLLDTRNSELSDFDKTERPLFDGNAISYDEQKSVVVTVWEK